MKSQSLYSASVVAVLMWMLSLPVQAATEAGRILFARGVVSIVDENESARRARVGAVFNEGERVVTGSNSIVQLRLTDGALTALRSNSEYHVQRQRFDEVAGIYEQAGRLVTGWMRSVTGTIGARSPGNVSQGTSVATIGIRGTVYQIIHVPEEGLPEFPNLAPGSYIYLEEGQIEVTNAAGSRLMMPGQVVRVRSANDAPELAPELADMFSAESVTGGGSADSSDFEIRELDDEVEDALGTLAEGVRDSIRDSEPVDPTPPPSVRDPALPPEPGREPFETFSGGAAIYRVDFGEGFSGVEGGKTNTFSTADITSAGFVRELSVVNFSGEVTLSGVGSAPSDFGGVTWSDGTRILWGYWENFAMEGEDIPDPAKDWHYIVSNNVVEFDYFDISSGLALTAGPLGRYRYDYAGGTAFTGFNSGGQRVSPLTLQNRSFMEIDFGSMDISANLWFRGDDTGTFKLTGRESISWFYEDGMNLSPSNVSGDAGGYMSGGIVGEHGGGIISVIDVFYDDNSYTGSAYFERGDAQPRFGGVSVFAQPFFSFAEQFVLTPFDIVEIGSVDGDVFVKTFEAECVDCFPIRLEGADTDGLNVSGLALNKNTNVYWGVWEAGSFAETMGAYGSQGDALEDWHFMITDNPMSYEQFKVYAGGVGGMATYNYAGEGTFAALQSGFVDVDFAALSMDFVLDFDDGVRSGGGSVQQFYDNGISLSFDDGVSTQQPGEGNISGIFIGRNANAIISSISTQAAGYGTALFRKGSSSPGLGQ